MCCAWGESGPSAPWGRAEMPRSLRMKAGLWLRRDERSLSKWRGRWVEKTPAGMPALPKKRAGIFVLALFVSQRVCVEAAIGF